MSLKSILQHTYWQVCTSKYRVEILWHFLICIFLHTAPSALRQAPASSRVAFASRSSCFSLFSCKTSFVTIIIKNIIMINLEEDKARSQSRNLAFCIPCFLLHLLQLHCLVGYESIDSIIRIINILA